MWVIEKLIADISTFIAYSMYFRQIEGTATQLI